MTVHGTHAVYDKNKISRLEAEITRLTAERDAAYTDIQEQREYINRLERLLNIAATKRDRLHSVLERARCILNNMAWENAGAIFNRWPISHEPLRNDARNLLPEADATLRDALEQTEQTK